VNAETADEAVGGGDRSRSLPAAPRGREIAPRRERKRSAAGRGAAVGGLARSSDEGGGLVADVESAWRISATRIEAGAIEVEPVELFRVFPPLAMQRAPQEAMHPLATADARPGWGGSILKLRSCGWRMSHNFQITEARMKKSNDLSKSLAPFEPDSSLVVVVELSQSSWLVAGRAASLDRQPTPIGVMGNASSPNAVAARPRGQRTEEIGTVAGAEGVGPRCRLSGRAQVVHQVARRQRPADRAFAEAVSVRTSAPDFMSPNGNAAASSRSKDYSRGRGGYRPSLRPFSGRQEPQVSARSSF